MEKKYVGARPFCDTDTGASSTPATASASPTTATERVFVTDIAGSTEIADAKIRVLDGSTTIWEMAIPVMGSATPHSVAVSFKSPLVGTLNTKVHVEVDGWSKAAPSGSCANIVGFIAEG